jgi:hypothetical protein
MPRHVRQPETTKIDLAQGDYLIVKKRLTAGEKKLIYERAGGASDRIKLAFSQAIAYLVDWGTFHDAMGQPMIIRGKPADEVGAMLDALDEHDYTEIIKAVGDHVDAMDAERAVEKNAQDGVNGSSPISPSPVDSTVLMTTS